jgi:hypothetical protein
LTKTVSVTIVDDNVAEPLESFSISLTNNSPGTKLGAVTTAAIAITDDDQAVQFSLPSYNVSEGVAKAVITVRRTGGTAGSMSVDYVAGGGTAGAGDYTATSGTLDFGPGVASRTFGVTIIPDAAIEGEETVNLTLQNPSSGLTILGTNPATLRIMDNEATVQFSASKYSVSEAATRATVTVKRTVNLTGTLVVTYTVSPGSASYGADFAGSSVGTLTFAPSIASQTFGVSLKPDTLDEPAETINLALVGVSPSNAAGLGTPQTAVISIADNDVSGLVQFASAAYSVSEGAGVATITVKRSGGAASGASVQYTAAVGGAAPATAGGDFTPVVGTLSFGAGEMVKTFNVSIANDGTPESGETVVLTLSSPSYGVKLGTIKQAVLWIVDDD